MNRKENERKRKNILPAYVLTVSLNE